MGTFLSALLNVLRAGFLTQTAMALENAALRQQLANYQRTRKRARLRTGDRIFWVLLRRLWSDWDRALIVVKPETVIAWHRQGFKLFWRRRSMPGKAGRPRIPRRHVQFIRRISADHPEWGNDKIAEELAAKFGIRHSGSTIRRYMVSRRSTPRGDQTWRTFVRNHAKEIWACAFLTQYTALFAIAYVFVVWRSTHAESSTPTSRPTRRFSGSSSRFARPRPGTRLRVASSTTMTGSSGSTAGE